MNCKLVEQVTKTQIRSDLPSFKAGDTIRLSLRITENGKSRIQIFQGVVIARRGHGVSETFIIRKVSSGVGVERNFPIHSPNLTSIEVLKRGKVRRHKIFYIRALKGKAARIKEDLSK